MSSICMAMTAMSAGVAARAREARITMVEAAEVASRPRRVSIGSVPLLDYGHVVGIDLRGTQQAEHRHRAMASASKQEPPGWDWRCLQCRSPLVSDDGALRCAGCSRQYPVIAGVPVLVRDPAGYVRAELEALARTYWDSRQRKDGLDGTARDAGLTEAALERHRDVLDVEIHRAETFLTLLEPAAELLTGSAPSLDTRRSGWTLDLLIPYLMRDWTDTAELVAISARIGAALRQALPDPSGKRVVFAACGAAGLLATLPPEFDDALGFDLTLPVLAAARRLLDGENIDVALPRGINEAGHITLRGRDRAGSRSKLAAMDALDTAFANDAVDCIVTSFLLDLIPEPAKLVHEIDRILADGGAWINYGPSGPLNALRRFDQMEGAAFMEAAGFTVIAAEAHRATYLDLSRDCPSWSFHSHFCYLTSARKTGPAPAGTATAIPSLENLPALIPLHFPGATLVERHGLGPTPAHTTTLRHEGIAGRAKSVKIGQGAARIMALVDGEKTVAEIAALLESEPPGRPGEETIRAFSDYFTQGLLSWRGA